MDQHPRLAGKAAALAVTAALLGAACGSSSHSPSSGPTSSTSAAAAYRNPPISILTIAPEGSQLGNHPEVPAAVRAASLAFNQSGGVDGSKVNVIYCNDQGQAQAAASCARQAVSDHVVAVVGSYTVYGDSVNPVLQAAGIPNLGAVPVEATDYSSPISFPLDAGAITNFQGDIFALARMGITKMAIASLDLPTTVAVDNELQVAIKAARTPSGKPVQDVGTVRIPVTASDYAPYANALHKGGAEGVVAVASPQQIEGLMTASTNLGLSATFATDTSDLSVADAKATASLGTLIGTHDLPPPTGTSSGARQFQADMKAAQKAGIPDANQLGYTAFSSWVGAEMFKQVADAVGGPLTAVNLLSALNAAKGLNVDGLLPAAWTPTSASRPAATARIAESALYVSKLAGNGDWQLTSPTPIDVAAALAG